ncbi:response regulator transcription factor [Streptomyces polychromogenes]|uniref:Response regulator transcription factor n=1 Tax=Streptomyces polychromogenes TaxID=67342 RepID=A0ABN0VET7_9ACTN
MAISVVLGGSRALYLEALAEALRSSGGMEAVVAGSGARPLLPLVHRRAPDVVLLEETPVGDDALRLASAVRAGAPACGIVLMMAGHRPVAVGRAMAAGVHGIVPTDTGLPQLIATLRSVAAGCVTMAPSPAGPAPGAGAAGAGPAAGLSAREHEVLRLTAGGATVKEIAAELCLAAGTVRNVTSASMKKLGGRNRFDAARIAAEQGWL